MYRETEETVEEWLEVKEPNNNCLARGGECHNLKWGRVSHQISDCFYQHPLGYPCRNPAQLRIQSLANDSGQKQAFWSRSLFLWLPSSACLETERGHRQSPNLLISIALLLAANACQCLLHHCPTSGCQHLELGQQGWVGRLVPDTQACSLSSLY